MIKIIKGSYGMRVGEVIKPVKAGQCCELSAAEEARLVRIGVAEAVEVVKAEPEAKDPEEREAAKPNDKSAPKAAAKSKAKPAPRAAAKPKASAEQAESEAGPLPDMQGADAVVG